MEIIKILEILQNYNISEEYPIFAEHDVIGFLIDYNLINQKDKKRLEELGCFYSDEYESLIMFV